MMMPTINFYLIDAMLFSTTLSKFLALGFRPHETLSENAFLIVVSFSDIYFVTTFLVKNMCPSQQRGFRALSKHKGKVLPIDFSFDVIPTWMPPSPPISEADCTTTTGGDLFYATLNNYLELYEAKLIPESRLPPLPSSAAALTNPLAASGPMRHLGSPVQNRQRRPQQQGLDNNGDTFTKDNDSECYPLVPSGGSDVTLSTKHQRRQLRRQLVAAANGSTVPTALKRRLRHKLENGGAQSGRGSATPDGIGSFMRRQSMQNKRKQSGSSIGDENISGAAEASAKTVYDSAMSGAITAGGVPNSQGVDYSSGVSTMDEARVRRHSSAARKQQLKYLTNGEGAPAENRVLLLHNPTISLTSVASSSGTPAKHLLNAQFRGFAPPDAGGEAPDYEGPPWTCEEDYCLLCAVTRESRLTHRILEKTLTIQLNWDFVADYVNSRGKQYRSARQCCLRYENMFMRMASIENVEAYESDNDPSNNRKQQRYAIYFDGDERIRQITADFQRRAHCVQRAVTYRKQNYQHPVRALRSLGGGPLEESPVKPDRLYCMQKSGSRLPPLHEQKLFELGISDDNAASITFKYENNIGVEENIGDAEAGPSSSSSLQHQLLLMTPRDVLRSRRKQQRHYYQQQQQQHQQQQQQHQQQQQQQQVNVVGAPTSMNTNNNDNIAGKGRSDPGSDPNSRPESFTSSSIVGESSGSSNNGNSASSLALVQTPSSLSQQQQPPQQDMAQSQVAA